MDRNAGRRGAQMNSMPQSVIEFSSLYLHHLRSPRAKRARIEERERERQMGQEEDANESVQNEE